MDHTPGTDQERRFRRLYETHYAAVLAYARRRTLDADDAQEVVAEVFTVAWRRLANVPEGDDALPWLYGVGRRVLANQWRGNRRRTDLWTRLTGQHTDEVEIESDVLSVDDRRRVLEALGRLKEADQEILRLTTWEELPHRQVAGILGCAEATVAVRLHRARNRLGREIEKGAVREGQKGSKGPEHRAEGQP
ncbi:MAG: sigma-70 family RNA polymerase sigma factor [Actinomycetota bacterium]|nr:sigma-70 family RNA polymerase sigma factor [Actinomycetota bacterium]